MATSTHTTPPPITLDTLARLSPSTYLLSPPRTQLAQPPSSSPAPTTIILCTWMAAPPRPIAKYLTAYTRLFPTSRILLITCSVSDVLSRSPTHLAAAVSAIRSGDEGIILAHAFSNGGAMQLVNLATAFRDATGTVLPIGAFILDSAPAKRIDRRGAAALVYALPKGILRWVPGSLVVYVLLCAWRVMKAILRMGDVIATMGRRLNDPGVMQKEAPRCYIYSEADRMVWWEDVEVHARAAEDEGWTVTREKFDGSGHVRHALADERRYWEIVKQHWDNQ